jgi:minor extracellular serine protease Vpr
MTSPLRSSRCLALTASITVFAFVATIAPAAAITPVVPIKLASGAADQVEHNATSLNAMYKALKISKANAGKGVKVGVIDSGIAVYPKGSRLKTNACFTDAGYPKTTQLGDTRYTNNKVIAARLFYHKPQTVAPGIVLGGMTDASAISPHGSHVAGTIGCNMNTRAAISGSKVGSISGIAPKVQLGSYVVFPGEDSGPSIQHIADAVDAAVADGMQIINMSLGGPREEGDTILDAAIARAHAAGVLVVVSAGNDGPDLNTVGSPGDNPEVISVGSVDGGRELSTTLTVLGKKYTGPVGKIGIPVRPVAGRLAIAGGGAQPSKACTADEIGPEVKGKIAIIARGDCYFITKLSLARDAGAIGAVLITPAADPVTAISTPYDIVLNLAAIMLDETQGAEVIAAAKRGASASFTTPTLKRSGNVNGMSEFSSSGPTAFARLVKPDIVAPGANILSAASSQDVFQSCATAGTCFQLMSGTSMAAPYVTGVAAVLRQAYPRWSVDMLRSALIHTAAAEFNASATPYRSGLGLINPAAAAAAGFGLNVTSLALAPGGSQVITLSNPWSQALKVTPSSWESWVEVPQPVVVPANGSVQLTVTLSASAPADGYGVLWLNDGRVPLRLMIRSFTG